MQGRGGHGGIRERTTCRGGRELWERPLCRLEIEEVILVEIRGEN